MKKLSFTFVIFLFLYSISYSQTWTQKLNGISMWSLCKDLQGNIYAGTSGTVKAIYKSTDGGNTWNPVLENSSANFLYLCTDSLNCIWAANVSNGLMKSTNGGNNWITIPVSTFNGKSVQSVVCGKFGHVYVGTVSGGIFRSTDYGVTFPDTAVSTGTFVTMVLDRYNPNIVYAGASSLVGLTGLYRSTNAGLTYIATNNANTCWGVIQKSTTEFYMATTTTGYPFTKSTDAGLSWTTVGTQPGAMRGMTLDAAGNIYICGNGGVFKSTNNGVSFTNANLTYSGNQIISYQNKILAAISGTANGGVWIMVDSTISGSQNNSESVPADFKLFQNYPNPFNQFSIIRYQLSSSGNVKIKIFDTQGKEIITLVNKKQNAGKYEIRFDGEKLSSGVFYYSLSLDNKIFETRKMLMIK